MKFGAGISAVAFIALLVCASPVSASVVDLHTLSDGNTFWGNGHSNDQSGSVQITDTYNFRLSTASSLTVFDLSFGFSDVTLELFSVSGGKTKQLSPTPTVSGSDPLILSDSDLAKGHYELLVTGTLPGATEEKIGRRWVTFPSTGGYLLDFDVKAPDPSSSSSSVSAVPEPSTWAMMVLGFCGLAFLTHRRRVAANALAKA